MTAQWENWTDDEWLNSYQHFLEAIGDGGIDDSEPGPQPLRRAPYYEDKLYCLDRLSAVPPSGDPGYESRDPSPPYKYRDVFVPPQAENEDFELEDWWPEIDKLPTLDANAFVVGVIDRGIPLGHERTRLTNGETRFLAAWQQGAPRRSGPSGGPALGAVKTVPFGTELYQHDINQQLRTHTVGSLSEGHLTEVSFNRACGSVDMAHSRAPRQLEGRSAHGAHVLDLAAGCDRFDEKDKDFRDRARLLSVTLPDRSTIHASGAFLDYFVLYAIQRVAILADLIWIKSYGDAREAGKRGYKMVINLAFGVQAGPKNGSSYFHKQVKALQEAREAAGFRPFHLVMPAGNDNLSRSRAILPVSSGGADIKLRVLPDDQSSNFVEVRTTVDKALIPTSGEVPLQIAVRREGERYPVSAGKDQQQKELVEPRSEEQGPIARIYCEAKEITAGTVDILYLICLAPTLRHERPRITAPPGAWTIALRSSTEAVLQVELGVQSDQSSRVGGATGLRAYFEDEGYERLKFTERGEIRDSYAYGLDHNDQPIPPNDTDVPPPVTRHGTIIDTAYDPDYIRAAGYRRSDGKPSVLSSTGTRGLPIERIVPTAALPTDDSPALFGTLGAGAANGSVVAMQGTSFACALATRCSVLALLDGQDVDDALKEFARVSEENRGDPALGMHFVGESAPAKVGLGRIAIGGMTDVPRLGPPLPLVP